MLLKKNETLAAAESCTGGLFSASITRIPGSSAYFRGGLIVYQLTTKKDFLKIPMALLKKSDGVSGQIARLMARRVRKAFKSDWGIGITGIAGPTGGTNAYPIGTVYIAVDGKRSQSNRFRFSGTRIDVQKKACLAGLKLVASTINKGVGDRLQNRSLPPTNFI